MKATKEEIWKRIGEECGKTRLGYAYTIGYLLDGNDRYKKIPKRVLANCLTHLIEDNKLLTL